MKKMISVSYLMLYSMVAKNSNKSSANAYRIGSVLVLLLLLREPAFSKHS